MLKWLIPPKIGRFRLFESKLLIIQIDVEILRATLIKINKNKNIVEKTFSKSLDFKENFSKKNFFEKEVLSVFLKEVFKVFGNFDEFWVIVPSSIAVFREITVPFIEKEKIDKILSFEMEPHLAFNSADVSIDYLLTRVDLPSTANLMTCMIRDFDFVKLVEALNEENQTCNKLVVDTVLIYEILKSSPQYYLSSSKILFFDLKEHSFTFGFLQDKKLTGLRVFDFGMFDIFNILEKNLQLPLEDIIKILEQNSVLGEPGHEKETLANKLLENLFKEAFFSVEAFLLNSEFGEELETLLLFDSAGGKIHILKYFLSKHFSINAEIFDIKNWFESSNIIIKQDAQTDSIDFAKLIALGVSDELLNFNLGKKLFLDSDKNILKKQFVFSTILIFVTIIFIFIIGLFKISSLNKIYAEKEAKLIFELKNILPKESVNPKKINLKKMLQDAVDLLEKKEKLQNLNSYKIPDFLVIYLELTRLFDKTRFGVSLINLTIKQDVDFEYKILIEGKFNKSKSITELDDFSAFLRVINLSHRFSVLKVSPEGEDSQNEIDFSISLGLVKNENIR